MGFKRYYPNHGESPGNKTEIGTETGIIGVFNRDWVM